MIKYVTTYFQDIISDFYFVQTSSSVSETRHVLPFPDARWQESAVCPWQHVSHWKNMFGSSDLLLFSWLFLWPWALAVKKNNKKKNAHTHTAAVLMCHFISTERKKWPVKVFKGILSQGQGHGHWLILWALEHSSPSPHHTQYLHLCNDWNVETLIEKHPTITTKPLSLVLALT